jgi:hypothetical protein
MCRKLTSGEFRKQLESAIASCKSHGETDYRTVFYLIVGFGWYCFNLIMVELMATEPTEKHGKKQYPF